MIGSSAMWPGALRALGVVKGDRVAMVIGNSIEFVVVMFAIARLGAISVPLNIRHQLAETGKSSSDCAAKVVVYEHDLPDKIPTTRRLPCAAITAIRSRRRGGEPLADLLASRAGDSGRRRSRKRRLHHSLHLGHDRPSKGRDADPFQHDSIR